MGNMNRVLDTRPGSCSDVATGGQGEVEVLPRGKRKKRSVCSHGEDVGVVVNSMWRRGMDLGGLWKVLLHLSSSNKIENAPNLVEFRRIGLFLHIVM